MNQISVLTSVITSSVYLSINKDNKIQTEEKFKPKNWMFDLLDQAVIDVVLDFFLQYDDTFRQTLNKLLAARLSLLMNAQNLYELDSLITFIPLSRKHYTKIQNLSQLQHTSNSITGNL